jgi:hypothetical protein
MFTKKEHFGPKIVNITPNGLPLSVHLGPLPDGKSIHVTETEKIPVYKVFQDITDARTQLRTAISGFKSGNIPESEVDKMVVNFETANRRAGQALKVILAGIITVARDNYGLPVTEIDVLLLQLLEENGCGTYETSRKAILEKTSRDQLSESLLICSVGNLPD